MTSVRGSADADGAAYRRGTVFGLTVAEVFILLLFLLLLLFLSLNQEWEIRAADSDDAKQKLVEVKAERDRLRQAEQIQRDKVRTLTKQRDDAFREASETLQLADADKRDLMREVQAAREEVKASQEEIQRTREAAGNAQQQADARIAAANERATQAERLLAKGENPPCWYRKVPDDKRGEREKPYYSVDVGVFDDYLIVRQLPPPQGGATDDNGGSFASEAEDLNFDRLPYNRMLTDSEFEQHFAPIWQAGRNAQVRSYPCIFWVKVWDQTAPGAKRRWKQAHDKLLEGLFGTYQVQDEPWLR